MSVLTVTSTFDRRYLMNKTKFDIASIALDEHHRMTRCYKAILEFGCHTPECNENKNENVPCDCGWDKMAREAQEWLGS